MLVVKKRRKFKGLINQTIKYTVALVDQINSIKQDDILIFNGYTIIYIHTVWYIRLHIFSILSFLFLFFHFLFFNEDKSNCKLKW